MVFGYVCCHPSAAVCYVLILDTHDFGYGVNFGYGNLVLDTFGYVSLDLCSFNCFLLDTRFFLIRFDTFGYFWIRLDTFGYIWICLDTFVYVWIRIGGRVFGYGTWNFHGFNGFAPILRGVPLGISSDFDGFVPILQRITLRMSWVFVDWHLFCKGHPLEFHWFLWICIYFARGTP